ncbi:MAG: hypothetical protein LBP92_00105 [Deltaproteobacteria bacterium]|nr:hypothetical protein [Deltaproteobacteria bacterium]
MGHGQLAVATGGREREATEEEPRSLYRVILGVGRGMLPCPFGSAPERKAETTADHDQGANAAVPARGLPSH